MVLSQPARSISLNFSGADGVGALSGTTSVGAIVDVRGDWWVNLPGASGEVEVTQVVGASGQETLLRPFRVTYSANGVGAVPESKSVSGLLKTYLEDAVSITAPTSPSLIMRSLSTAPRRTATRLTFRPGAKTPRLG